MSSHSLLVAKPFRPLLLLAGTFFVVLGAVGVVVPLLPTTPFMLLAIWCFARSSQKFHDWLYHHPVFGRSIRDWEQHGVIARKSKIITVGMIAVSYGMLVIFTDIPVIGMIGAGTVLAAVALFLATRPEQAPETESKPKD